MPTAKKLFPVLRQTIIILTLTIILSEISLRIYNQFDRLPIFYDTSYSRFRGKPFSRDYDFRLNSHGFKDVEFSIEKPDGTFRILGIGDSFAFGVIPYSNNYLTLLEDSLKQTGEKIELINMGIPGIDSREYVSLFIHEGLELKPDMVLLSFFVGNDFKEGRRRRLYDYSYLVSAIKYTINLYAKFETRPIHAAARYDDNSKTFSDDSYLQLERDRSYIYLKQNSLFATEFAITSAHLIRLRELCQQRNVKLMIVVIPDEVQVNKALQEQVVRAYGLNPNEFDFSLPNKVLTAKLKEQNIQYIDLLDDFVAESEHTILYKPNNTHWNIAGNKFAAQLIEKQLAPQLRSTNPR